jgi:hypothetical protein
VARRGSVPRFQLPPHQSASGQRLPADPCHTTVHTGPYTALLYRRLRADALGSSRDLPDAMLKPVQGLGRYEALDPWTSSKAEPEKLSFLWSRHRTLRLVHLELEPLGDESRDALHHPATRPFGANVDVTVSRPGESHPEPLSEPYLNLSAHTAPAMEPRRTPICQCAHNYHRGKPLVRPVRLEEV